MCTCLEMVVPTLFARVTSCGAGTEVHRRGNGLRPQPVLLIHGQLPAFWRAEALQQSRRTRAHAAAGQTTNARAESGAGLPAQEFAEGRCDVRIVPARGAPPGGQLLRLQLCACCARQPRPLHCLPQGVFGTTPAVCARTRRRRQQQRRGEESRGGAPFSHRGTNKKKTECRVAP